MNCVSMFFYSIKFGIINMFLFFGAGGNKSSPIPYPLTTTPVFFLIWNCHWFSSEAFYFLLIFILVWLFHLCIPILLSCQGRLWAMIYWDQWIIFQGIYVLWFLSATFLCCAMDISHRTVFLLLSLDLTMHFLPNSIGEEDLNIALSPFCVLVIHAGVRGEPVKEADRLLSSLHILWELYGLFWRIRGGMSLEKIILLLSTSTGII